MRIRRRRATVLLLALLGAVGAQTASLSHGHHGGATELPTWQGDAPDRIDPPCPWCAAGQGQRNALSSSLAVDPLPPQPIPVASAACPKAAEGDLLEARPRAPPAPQRRS